MNPQQTPALRTLPNGDQYTTTTTVKKPKTASKNMTAAKDVLNNFARTGLAALTPVIGPVPSIAYAQMQGGNTPNIFQRMSGKYKNAPATQQPVAQPAMPQQGGMSEEEFNATFLNNPIPQRGSSYSGGSSMQMGSYGMPQQDMSSDEIKTLFGVNDMTELQNMRSRLGTMKAQVAAGLPVADSEVADILGFDKSMKYSPEQINAIRAAKADYFTAPMNAIDSYVKQKASQQGDSADVVSSGVLSGVDKFVARQVLSDLDSFNKTEDSKAYFAAQRANALIQGVDPNSSSSPQQQGIISDFAKSLDPISVVREGEYALAAKYSQSAISKAKGEISQFVKGEGMLSPQAIQILQEASAARMNSLAQRRQDQVAEFENYVQSLYGIPNASGLIYNPTSGNEQRQSKPQVFQAPTGMQFELGSDGLYYPKGSGARSGSSKTMSLQEAKQRIANVESQGSKDPYRVPGVVVTKGMYAGERAIGKYQVMPSNVESWTKEALGKPLTAYQFYNSPEAQERVADYKLAQLYKKYGNWDDVASAWLTGKPLSKAGNAKDDLGTSAYAYVKKFNS